MVVDPVIITPARLIHEKRVVFETMFLEPGFGYLLVLFGRTRGEKSNPVSCLKKLVYGLFGASIGFTRFHPLRLFVWYVISNSAIDID